MRLKMLAILVPTAVLLLTASGRAATVELSNTAPVTVSSNGACCSAQVASSYPSSIEVSGLDGITTKVAVTLHEVSDTDSEDLAVLLVGPSGRGVVLMASYEQGRHLRLDDATWTFETFAQPIACPAPEGTFPAGDTFAPFDCGLSEPFPAPAPPGPYEGMLEALGGNGVWSLYADNQPGGEEGRIAGGWSLQITVQPIGYIPPHNSPTPADQSGNEAAARAIQEQHEREAREASRHAVEDAGSAEPLKKHPACVVPVLKGDTLAAARHTLVAAHCRLGDLHQPKRHRGALRVRRQSPRAGKRLADDARVALWFSAGKQKLP